MGRPALWRLSRWHSDNDGLYAPAQPHETWSDELQDEYVLVLEDIDELFTAMVSAANINPTFLGERHRLKPALREWYAMNNVHSMADLFRIDPPAGS